jgi:hypothetical protein
VTRQRALEILRDHWGYRRPLTGDVRAEIAALGIALPPFQALAEVAGLPLRAETQVDPIADEERIEQSARNAAPMCLVWLSHDWVRRTCENLLSWLPELERQARLRAEWANGNWTATEPWVPNDHPNEQVPSATPAWEDGVR